MKNPEQFRAPIEQSPAGVKEQEKIARLISRYIEKIVGANKSTSPQEEKEIQGYYKGLSVRERADVLYGKLMAHIVDKQAGLLEKPDPYLISEIRVLFGDGAVKELFSAVYGQARVDAKKFRISELGKLWQETGRELSQKEKTYGKIVRDLHLNKIIGRGNVSSAKSRLALLAENINALETRRQSMETLRGFPETDGNTDAAAHFQYEKLKEYRRQMLGEGRFVWLPSRKEIHRQTVSAILNHRWPVLIGEAGTGKSQQANAAALELTGHLPTRLKCESPTGEKQMLGDLAVDPNTGGSYKEYGPLMQAFTGFENSLQETPSFTGRICDFEESGRLGPRGYSIIKEARQLIAGDELNGKPVLPGAGAIWTTNPVGPRYPDRHAPDPAMRRELAEIRVDYPEMSEKNPELYEFALTALLDDNNLIAAVKEELSPAYEKKEIPENKREALEDGSIVIARDEIIKNAADARHGALWRFAAAIKALQDSFVYGNAETEKYPDNFLRFKEDADGKIEITTDGSGEPLTLSTSTVTLGELASWMSGFNERRQKRDAEFRTGTLTEWLNFKINTYLKQADNADKEKLRALFGHFGFLEKSVIPDISGAEPLTPKEIGYLSPRIPRPAYFEKPKPAEEPPPGAEKPSVIYETRQVLLETGERILINNRQFPLKNGRFDLERKKFVLMEVAIGAKFKVSGKDFVFAGAIEDPNSKNNDQPVGRFVGGENLYKIFKPEELDSGILEEFASVLGWEQKDTEENIEDFCASGGK